MGTTAQKLAYLNETKTKIKNAINLGEAGITNETFRQYEKGIKQALLNTMNDKWSTWNNFEKVTETGENISANQTVHAPMALTLKGNTSQYTTTGKNKVSLPLSYNNVGITITPNSNGTFTINGTRTSGSGYIYSDLSESITLEAGTYTFYLETDKLKTNDNSLNIGLRREDNTSVFDIGLQDIYRKVETKTFDSQTTIKKLSSWINSGDVHNNINVKMMVVSGTYTLETIGEWEPYTGGIASPNPDYPQVIHTITGDNTIKVVGKNRLDVSNYYVEPVSNRIGIDVEDLIIGEQYTFSSKSNVTQIKISTGSTSASSVEYASSTPFNTYTFTMARNSSLSPDIPQRLFLKVNNVWVTDLSTINSLGLMIEKGDTATTYQEYQGSQTYPISLGELKLCKIGDYQDYFTKNSSGQWCKYNAIGKEIFGNLYIRTWTSTYYGLYFYAAPNNIRNGSVVLSDIYKQVSATPQTWVDYTMTIDGKNIQIKDSRYTSVSDYQEAVYNNFVYYQLEVPYLSLIENETLISQLDKLEKALSKDGQTNISQVNNDKPFIIEAIAIKQF